MSCDEWREDVSAWVDGELASRRHVEVDAHLKSCRDCRRLAREFQQLAELARRAPVPRARPKLADAAMALVHARGPRRRWSWWPHAGMFWPNVTFGAAALAVAGFLAFIVMQDNQLSVLDEGGELQKSAAMRTPSSTALDQPGPRTTATVATTGLLPTSGGPPIVGNLVVDNSAVGTERLGVLARSLGGRVDTVATPAESTIYVSIPPSAQAVFQARLPEIGAWQRSSAASESGETVVGIRIIQEPDVGGGGAR